MTSSRFVASALAAILATAVAGCTAKESTPADGGKASATQVTVNATDTGCAPSTSEGAPGSTTFVVTNNGAKVTEFYVYGKDDRVLAEVENISPGLHRNLVVEFNEPGTYRLACKPGMVGDGIRTDFTVKAPAQK